MASRLSCSRACWPFLRCARRVRQASQTWRRVHGGTRRPRTATSRRWRCARRRTLRHWAARVRRRDSQRRRPLRVRRWRPRPSPRSFGAWPQRTSRRASTSQQSRRSQTGSARRPAIRRCWRCNAVWAPRARYRDTCDISSRACLDEGFSFHSNASWDWNTDVLQNHVGPTPPRRSPTRRPRSAAMVASLGRCPTRRQRPETTARRPQGMWSEHERGGESWRAPCFATPRRQSRRPKRATTT